MRHSTMTIDHFKKVVILFCVIALISFSCKKNDVPEEENSSSTQVNEKASPQKDDASTAQNMVVEVNGIKLTQKQVDEKMNVLIAAIKNQVPPDRIEEVTRDLREKVIADFITRTVVNQEADKHNITASEDEVNATLSKLEKNLPEDMTLKAVLTQGGMSLEDMRNDIIFSVRTNKLMESQIKDDTKPSDEEIKKYYTDNKKQFSTPETVHARHILMKADEKDDEKTKDEKKAIIEGLRKQLLEGADFEKLAKENSSCPSGKKGGDLGAFPRGRMAKPFEEAAFSQKVNDIGPIVQTRFGYHIIQVLAHNQATEKKLDDETKEKITATMVAKKKQELAKNYINKLKENAKIVYATEDTSKE